MAQRPILKPSTCKRLAYLSLLVISLFYYLSAWGSHVLLSGRFVDKGFVTECIHYGLYLVIFAFLLLGSCAFLMQWSVTIACVCFLTVPLLQGIGFGIIFPAYNSLFINLGTHNQQSYSHEYLSDFLGYRYRYRHIRCRHYC